MSADATATPAGLIIVDKPAGWTSHDVVAKCRGLAATRKVGHAGTLDPMATGVLVIGVQKATRLMGYLALTDKEYLATIRLGEGTVTDDAEGDTIDTTPAGHITRNEIDASIPAFVGEIEQVPSAVSAIKVDGVRSYARVRAGEAVELKARRVTISRYEVLDVRHSGDVVDVDVRVECSSGTYIRALARDLGASLKVGGHLTSLRRTRVGPFTLKAAHTLDELQQDLTVIGLSDVARASFVSHDLNQRDASDVRFGRALTGAGLPTGGPIAVFDPAGEFLALYEQSGQVAKPVAVFV